MRWEFVIAVAVLIGLALFLFNEVRRPHAPAQWGRTPRWKKKVRIVLASLPFIVGLLVTLTTPSYMVPMFTTTLGFIWLGIAAILMTFGVWIMAKMVSFDF